MITIDGRYKEKLIRSIKNRTDEIEKDIEKAVAETVSIMKTEMQMDAPVLTGDLRRSISRRKLKPGKHVVRVKVKYGRIVEYRMLKRGESYFNKNVERGKDYLENQLRKIARKGG